MLLSVHVFGHDAAHSKHQKDVVLIHGTGADASLWQPQIELIASMGCRAIVPELRGHGQTAEPGEPAPLAVHINDVLETLESVNVRYPAVWVGHSLGAIISMVLAESRPELFEKVLAVSMPGRVPVPVSLLFRLLTTWPFQLIRGTTIHRMLPRREQILVDTDLFSLQQIVANFARVNFVERTPSVSCPVHFSVGRKDFVAPWRHVRSMHEALPHSTLRVFDGAGHCCMDDRPAEFQEWFLEKLADSVPVSGTVR